MSYREERERERQRKKARKEARRFPIATAAYYEPDDQRASKLVVGILKGEGREVELRKWYFESGDVRTDPQIQEETDRFLRANGPKKVVAVDRIWSCPHEEGTDYGVPAARSPAGSSFPRSLRSLGHA